MMLLKAGAGVGLAALAFAVRRTRKRSTAPHPVDTVIAEFLDTCTHGGPGDDVSCGLEDLMRTLSAFATAKGRSLKATRDTRLRIARALCARGARYRGDAILGLELLDPMPDGLLMRAFLNDPHYVTRHPLATTTVKELKTLLREYSRAKGIHVSRHVKLNTWLFSEGLARQKHAGGDGSRDIVHGVTTVPRWQPV